VEQTGAGAKLIVTVCYRHSVTVLPPLSSHVEEGFESLRQRRWNGFSLASSSLSLAYPFFWPSMKQHGENKTERRSTTMAGKMDQAKGRVKEAGGALTGNERLKQEGKLDQAAGKVKEGATKAVNTVKKALSGKRPSR
jgi:uncharacterized protein YjbJ (UPF0337 family)